MITIEITGVDAARHAFSSTTVDNAMRSTLNKLAAQAATVVSKKIRETYNIKARDLNTAIKVVKARSIEAGSQLIAAGPRLPLIYFDAQETIINGSTAIISRRKSGGLASRSVRKGNKKRGVTVKVLNAGGRKFVQGPNHFGGFFVGVGGSHQIFMRSRASQFPIEKRAGPAVAQMLGKHTDIVRQFVISESARIFSSELDFYASQAANRGL